MEDIIEQRNAPFLEKMDFIRDIVLKSVKRNIIKKVYLFGSYAYGEPNEDSDVDLCVIIANNSKRRDIALKIKIKLIDNKIIPTDLIVYNEDEFEVFSKETGVEKTIRENGKLLYG